uniref:Caspase-8 n=1 Tax=Malurus cyaneus samueli TaxID=2593467 RepID=A0A8C5UDY9_9PASS
HHLLRNLNNTGEQVTLTSFLLHQPFSQNEGPTAFKNTALAEFVIQKRSFNLLIKEYSKKDHRNMDCFVCFILSHGEKDKIKGVDDECVNIEELTSCFTGTNCPSLAGKPKVFIIQACQGMSRHRSVTVEADSTEHLEEDATPSISIPDKADFLIGMATVEDCQAFRNPKSGSVYIQSLCKKMEFRVDFITILTKVNQELAEQEFGGSKQMPKITSTLLMKLIFEIPQCKMEK